MLIYSSEHAIAETEQKVHKYSRINLAFGILLLIYGMIQFIGTVISGLPASVIVLSLIPIFLVLLTSILGILSAVKRQPRFAKMHLGHLIALTVVLLILEIINGVRQKIACPPDFDVNQCNNIKVFAIIVSFALIGCYCTFCIGSSYTYMKQIKQLENLKSTGTQNFDYQHFELQHETH